MRERVWFPKLKKRVKDYNNRNGNYYNRGGKDKGGKGGKQYDRQREHGNDSERR